MAGLLAILVLMVILSSRQDGRRHHSQLLSSSLSSSTSSSPTSTSTSPTFFLRVDQQQRDEQQQPQKQEPLAVGMMRDDGPLSKLQYILFYTCVTKEVANQCNEVRLCCFPPPFFSCASFLLFLSLVNSPLLVSSRVSRRWSHPLSFFLSYSLLRSIKQRVPISDSRLIYTP